MKFKKGDRVVRINQQLVPGVPVGKAGTVMEFKAICLVLWDGIEKPEPSFTGNLEFEVIYNSPLEQALR